MCRSAQICILQSTNDCESDGARFSADVCCAKSLFFLTSPKTALSDELHNHSSCIGNTVVTSCLSERTRDA